MFQKSLLKNFIKSFNTPNSNDIIKLTTKDKFIAEDANGAEFISLLANILNWTNCIREVKNDTDMKKADGVVYDKNNNPIVIIELKSSDKKISNRDIIAQAFRYKNEKSTCKYVVISNFKQLDIYSESSDVCFSLDMTKPENYTTLYALLNQSSLETNEIARLKKLSKSQEQITKEVYKEYSSFRLKLLNNLIENNKELSREDIFESANKLLDRFMFILFAEDRGLIPANSIDTIINQYENSKDGWDDVKPLYYYYKKYFEFIDIGNSNVNIPKYNGNLFKPDEQLESLIIDDHIIKDDLSHLSAKDFSDDVDVEVLGHIFEQSLNDLEKIKESLFQEHKIVDTRKKDGVFYTPKFITEYIINNTIALTCKEKKDELHLHVEIKDTKKAKEKRRETLHVYRKYLEGLKIVDPACGSGAFLTACFRYLLSEHKWIQNELFKYEAGLFDYHDVDKQIIENNLFGVDINNASVGIAKLSLWLQTAKRNRPLSNLMDNIKCANSLTTDWKELFPEIIANGGFDCVVGNPPYVGEKGNKEVFRPIKEIWKDRYEKNSDLLYFFFMKSIDILKENGNFGFITTNYYLTADGALKLRKELKERTAVYNLINFNEMKLFESALGQHNIITIFKKTTKVINADIINVISPENITQEQLFTNSNEVEVFTVKSDELYDGDKNYIRVSKQGNNLDNVFSKMTAKSKLLGVICNVNQGLRSGADKLSKKHLEEFPTLGNLGDGIFILTKNELSKLNLSNIELETIIKKLYKNSDIDKYNAINNSENYLLYIDKKLNELEFKSFYPNIYKFLNKFKNLMYKIRSKNNEKVEYWFTLDRTRNEDIFTSNKIIAPQRSNTNTFAYSEASWYASADVYYITTKLDFDIELKYILALLNSKLYYTWLYYKGKRKGKMLELYATPLSQIPIKDIPKEQQKPFINLVDAIIDSKEKIAKYKKYFESLSAIDKIEITEEIEKLESIILNNVDEIDGLVYELYGLNNDEILIVEDAK